MKLNSKQRKKFRIKNKLKKVSKKDRYRLSVSRSTKNISAQIIDDDKNIKGLSFEGEGCAISLASASILTDLLKGKDLSFTKKVTDDFLNMIKTKSKITLNSLSEDQITTINSLSGVQEFPMRIKCATMAWHTLLSAVEKKNT